jgi:DNA-binding NarL/FixJ family response regulator
MMAKRRIMVADRSALFARGVSELLTARGYEVVGVASTAEELLALAAAHPEAMVLVDELLGGETDPDFIRELAAQRPEQSIVALNGTGRVDDVIAALAAGVAGVINRNAGEDHIFAAIDVVAGGGLVLCSDTVASLREQLTEVFELMSLRTLRRLALTEREMELLRLLPTALTLGQIASQLHVSRKTAQNNASSLYRKLGAVTRSEAVAEAITHGLLAPRLHPRSPADSDEG